MSITVIVLIVVAVAALWAMVTYNRLIRLRNEADSAFSGIDVQLKRRADLIPNLVETVKGYAGHESGVFQAVTEARSHTLGAASQKDTEAADRETEAAVGKLIAVAEAYPDLKASANFQQLQEDLSDTEDKIAAARRYFNTTTRRYNDTVQSVPSNIIAGMGRFSTREYYRLEDDTEREPVAVSL